MVETAEGRNPALEGRIPPLPNDVRKRRDEKPPHSDPYLRIVRKLELSAKSKSIVEQEEQLLR